MANKTQKTNTQQRDKIVAAYIDYVLTEGKDPASIYAFAKQLKISEPDFYTHFVQFKDIDLHIWTDAIDSTIETLKNSEEYANYSSREKILGLFYTLIMALNQNRSYFIYSIGNRKPLFKNNDGIKSKITEFAKEVIQEGLSGNEIEERKFISDRYHEAVWMNTLFILNFWMEDDSKEFAKTDAAIEKSVNLIMELMGKSALDSILDLGKFLVQNKSKSVFKM
jgi:hypothetical protein